MRSTARCTRGSLLFADDEPHRAPHLVGDGGKMLRSLQFARVGYLGLRGEHLAESLPLLKFLARSVAEIHAIALRGMS
jgi:hypothetical protein